MQRHYYVDVLFYKPVPPGPVELVLLFDYSGMHVYSTTHGMLIEVLLIKKLDLYYGSVYLYSRHTIRTYIALFG